jgi:ERCC4-related helicase
MILDNLNSNPKVYEWIEQNTSAGNLDIVTGYFTIGALNFISETTNSKVEKYRFIIGDIVSSSDQKIASLDLLNETLDESTAWKLRQWALTASDFLKQNKVECKTLEPNFCHAKLYLLSGLKNPMHEYYITGSSNLTDAGIGKTQNQNVELNIAGTGTESTYRELKEWFSGIHGNNESNGLWNSDKAHKEKEIIDENGKKKTVDFKKYLISEISKIFVNYEPIQIYQKILLELFEVNADVDFEKELAKLRDTAIGKALFSYQENGVSTILKKLDKYDGAILADAVGLGKTWTTLGIIKHYQKKGRKTVVICPKKLEQNWIQYQANKGSIFEADNFIYNVYSHSDLTENIATRGIVNLDVLLNEEPKLIVIDESHNLRNNKSIRYKVLMEEVLQKSRGDIKILLLSATPINNNFNDLRNQFNLLTKGNDTGFEESLGVRHIDYTFKQVQSSFKKWSKDEKKQNLSSFYAQIKDNDCFQLIQELVVARTRKVIKERYLADIHFPNHNKPINLFKTPLEFGDFESFDDLMEKLKLNLSAYQPTKYTLTKAELKKRADDKKAAKEKKNKDNIELVIATKDEVQREQFLVKMMQILMLKRLESSWLSFKSTIEKILAHHENALKVIKDYKDTKKEHIISQDIDGVIDDNSELFAEYTLSKNEVKISEIDKKGRLDDFRKDILKDKENLQLVLGNIKTFEDKFNLNSDEDIKLLELKKIISEKHKSENNKLIIFTAYKDTAEYLFKQLKSIGINKIGLVYGDTAIHSEKEENLKIQQLLLHFAPYTKLYLEKRWLSFGKEKSLENYPEWKEWIAQNDSNNAAILDAQLDILITTDVLSEGQNLQDADMVVNYDIHWNPVRAIQRLGRIDRIGSPNPSIQCVNFWPTPTIDAYINLKSRVERRMATMQLVGSEVIEDFTDEFREIATNPVEEIQTENLLKQMQNTMEDLDGEDSFGFDDFSLDGYQYQLQQFFDTQKKEITDLPRGIYSGVTLEGNHIIPKGMIALLGVLPRGYDKYSQYELLFFDEKGELISENKHAVLQKMTQVKDMNRSVDARIDACDLEAIAPYQSMVSQWIKEKNNQKIETEDGVIELAGELQLNALSALQKGNTQVINQVRDNKNLSKKDYHLVAWLIIN